MISVIIPLYNKEPIIGRCLHSVLLQDYDDFEIVIVNDGSTDRSAEIVKSINDPRLVYIEQENCGPSMARNNGIKHSKGDWIVFLDADDEFLPGALKRYALIVEENYDCGFVASPYYIFDGKNREIIDNKVKGIVNNIFCRFFYCDIKPRMGAYAISREIVLNCLFDEKIRRYEDLKHLFQVFRYLNESYFYKVIYDLEPSMVLNIEYASASHSRKDISEDFVGYLSFHGKSFWEKMCLYKLYLSERPYYVNQIDKLYPVLKYRYDLLLLTKILNLSFVKLFLK